MARYREGTGTALLVAIGSFSVFAILAWIVAVMLWVALSIYALVEMIGPKIWWPSKLANEEEPEGPPEPGRPLAVEA